ncbi:MAG: flagellar biosynthesis protein FlhB [Gammaproteobacteria bacterium TMED92]|nr:MAG: flagellar biosynthesis protein FlhB [Gammaproteobacteria bacterium TMED92]
MAEEQDQDDKTEDPTARRMEKAREDGQVLRSQDASTAAVTLGVIATLYFGSSWFAPKYVELFKGALILEPGLVFSAEQSVLRLSSLVIDSFLLLTPLFLIALALAVGTASALGGFVFSAKAAAPKLSKLNPIKGMARIFGLRALVELSKSLLKFSAVAVFAGTFLYFYLEDFFYYAQFDVNAGIVASLELVALGATTTCLALLLIAAIDVPYQKFEFTKKLKMTKKEVRDEMKDIQGQPEVRQKIRQKQREIAEQRMLDEVPGADVIVTNPQHFAVALVYEMDKEDAPRVVAKGKGYMALKIRELAGEHDVEIFEAPPLARALYFTTEIGSHIPADLFYAVAQVIAYVYGLNAMAKGATKATRPKPKVPKAFNFDEYGRSAVGKTL